MGRLVTLKSEEQQRAKSTGNTEIRGKTGRLVRLDMTQQTTTPQAPFTTTGVQGNTSATIKTAESTTAPSTASASETTGRTLPAERGYKHKTNAANQQRQEQRRVVSDAIGNRKYSVAKGLEGAAAKGVNLAAQATASTLALAEDIASAPFELLSGQELGDLSDTAPLNRLAQRIRNEGKEFEEKYAENVEYGGKGAEMLDKYGSATVAAIPQAILAFATGGASTAGQLTSAAKGLAGTIGTAVSKMAKDPQYWLAFIQAVGTGYDSALADMEGVDNTEARTKAALFAVGNGLMNAAVEVGGGVQKLPEQLRHGAAAWKNWLESALEEGEEEVVQGVIERALQNFTYDKGNTPISLTDENAVFSLPAALDEFMGGTIVGGVLGAGQVGAASALNRIADANMRKQIAMQEANLPASQTTQERTQTVPSEMIPAPTQNAPAVQEIATAPTVSQETPYVSPRASLDSFEKVLGESGKKAIQTAYQDGTDIDVFTGEFLRAYHAGETGQTNPNARSAVSYIAYEAGKNDAAASLAEAKRAELMLDNMLTNGYRTTYGEEVSPNADYLAAKQAIPGAETVERASEELPVWDIAEPEEEVSRETAARRAAQVRSAAAALGQNGSRALSSVYDENTARSYAPEDAVRDFYQVYNAALNGTADSNTTAPDYLRLAARNAGERDARASTQAKYFGEKAGLVRDAGWKRAKLTSRESYALDALAKVTGTEIRFADTVENGRANAAYRDGVMTLALDAENPVMVSAVHETVHRLRETAPEAYMALADFVQTNLSEEGTKANLTVRERMYKTSDTDTLTEETVADAFGAMLEDSSVLEQFATEHRSAARKLMDALHDLVVKIKRALNGGEVRLSDNQKAAFRDLADKVGEMERLFSEALETTQSKENAANEGGGTKFSIKMLDDGRYYVKSDRQVLSGNDPKQWGKQLQNYINTEIRKGNDIVLPTTDGRMVRITERSAYKLADDKTTNLKTHEKTKLSDANYRLKEEAASHIDEIVLTGEFSHSQEDIGGYHENDIGEDGFNTYTAYFEDSNGEYYRIDFVSALNGDMETAYSIGDIQKRKKPASGNGSSARESSALNGGKLSTDNVAQSSSNVKPKFSLKTDSEGRRLTEAQEEYFKDSKVRDAEGRLKPVYHGTSRADRVGNVFRPERATSGPMAFFTDNADIAQHYSRDKSDTSVSYDTDYDSYETQFRTAKGGKSISLIDSWRQLPLAAKRTITERAGHVRMDMDGDGDILYDPDTTDANGGFSWQMKEARGNTLAALNEQWLNSGMLFNEEGRYMDVLREAGVFDALEKAGYDAPKYYDPNYREEKVYKEYLNITNPFNAQEQATEDFLREFEAWYNEQDADRYDTDSADADFWDKRNVSAEDFAERVRDDIEDGTSRAWTSIPDSVTDFLKENGYDGIIDKGGKNGGEEHTVYIPFSSEQVKNVDNLSPTSSEDIRYSLKYREALDKYIEQYGEIPSGEKPYRTVKLPKRTAEDKYVSRTIRTVLEAKATPEAMVPTIEDMVADGKFSYDRYTDKQAVADAESKIKSQGWQKTLNQWKRTTKSEVSKEAMATGWALYNNAATSGDVETALEVLDDMVAKSRNAAQALQAVRILKQQEPSAQLYGVERSVESLQEDLKKQYGKNAPELEIDRALAEKFLNARTDKARTEAMGEIYRDIGRQMPSRFMDKWNAWRYLSMLGNPRTHMRNIMGNAGFAPLVGVKNLVGAGLESAANAATGGKVGRTKAVLTMKDTDLIKAAWNDYANIEEQALGEGKYSERAAARKEIEEGRVIFQTKPLEKFRRFNSAALDREDVWFSKPHYASALAQYCKANGITAEQIASGKGLEAARNYAIREAQKATYRDTNAFSEMVSRMGRANSGNKNSAEKIGSTVLEGVLPFRKTPANILVRGVEYSPIELLKAISYDLVQVKKGKMEATEMLDHLSTGLTGTGVMILGAFMAAEGLMGMRLRGSGGDDEDKKDFDELRGHQDYSLELADGTSITLDWLAPEVLPLFVGANLVEQMQKRSGGELTISDALEAVSNVSDPLLEMSCLQSLNDLFDSVGYAASGETSALASVVASAATSYLTQALPTLLGQVERTGEDTRMTTYTDKNNKWLTGDMQYALGKASSRLPAWDYNQIPYIDAWGRTESSGGVGERAFNNFLNPAYTSTVESSATEDELERLYEATGEKSVLPDRAERYFTVDGERKDLTGEEYVKYATARGQTAYRIISELVSSSAYKALDESDKASAVSEAYSVAKASAKMQVSSYKPDGKTAKCIEAKQKYGIDEAQFILLYQEQSNIESLKDSEGKTISLSEGLQVMELIYQQKGLSDAQRTALFEAFNVPKSIRHYNKALVTEKLKAMRKKAK